MEILLYKLKDIENIKEIIKVCKELNIKISIIRRENTDIDYEFLSREYKIDVYDSFDTFLRYNKDKRFLFFETYGDKLLYDVNLRDFDIFVFGAEDYGIPLYEIEKVRDKEVVKIPTKIPGSYNVASSVVIFLTFYFS